MSCAWPGVRKKPRGRPLPSHRAWSLVLNPPRERPRASASCVPFSSRPHNGAPERSLSRSYRRWRPAPPSQRAFRASRRTRPPAPICHTCLEDAAVARRSALSTPYPRSSAGCPAPADDPARAQAATTARSAPTPRPKPQSAPPNATQKASVESSSEPAVKLCPRNLGTSVVDMFLAQKCIEAEHENCAVEAGTSAGTTGASD